MSALLGVGIARADHLWETVPDAFAHGLAALEDTLSPALAQGAVVARITGGTLVVAFVRAADAAASALELLARELPWPQEVLDAVGGPPIVQIAVDLGEPLERRSPLSGRVLEGPAIRQVLALARRCPRGAVLISARAWEAGAVAGPGHQVAATHEVWVVSREREPPVLGIPEGRGRFVGRWTELEAIAGALAAGQRLLVLTGPGGAGKTRLAAEWARSASAIWVDLAPERSAEGAAVALARALGLPGGSRGDPAVLLGQTLARRGPCAMVLDNTEQLPDDWLALPLALLERAPSLSLLLTSRRSTGHSLEWRLPVGPLASAEAIELLRARSAAPLPDQDLEVLVEALDRLPLPLELAARRTAQRSVPEILEQLRQRPFRTLRQPGSQRHDTLLATLEWSWQLLSEPARDVFSAVAAFAGRFRTTEAEHVVGELRGPADAPDAAERLDELADASLVVTHGQGEYYLLDTVRAYARLKLEQRPDMPQILARHASYCISLPMGREGPGQLEDIATLRRLRRDLEEIVERCERDAPDLAGQAALRLSHYVTGLPLQARLAWTTRWRSLVPTDALIRARLLLIHGDAKADAGLDASAEFELAAQMIPEHASMRASVAMRRGGLALLALDYAQAMAHYIEAAEAASSVQDHVQHAWAVAAQGRLLHQQLKSSEALARLDVALVLARRAGALEAEGSARSYRSMVLRRMGRLQESRDEALAAHRLARETGRPDMQGFALIWAAAATLEAGDAERAAAELLEVIAFARERGQVAVEGAALTWLSQAQQRLGKLDLAFATLAEEEALSSPTHRVRELVRGAMLCELGELQAAERALRLARERSPPVPAVVGEIAAWEALVQARSGDLPRAEHLLAQASASQLQWPELAGLVALAQLEIEVQRARLAPEDARAALVGRCQERLPEEVPALAVNMARIVREGLRRLALGQGQVASVHDGQKVLILPGGRRLDFARRGPLWRILRLLVDARLAQPGSGLPLEALIEAGWPKERIVASAASNRAYVAVATLRKLGLAELLVTADDGYRLSTELVFTLAASGPPADYSAGP